MNMVLRGNQKKNKIKEFITDTAGNSIPLVLLVALVVMIIGGAVANGTMQLFSAVRAEANSQMTYLAAETALERSMCSLDSNITKEIYAESKSIDYSGAEDFINNIIESLNEDALENQILRLTEVGVYANSLNNKATASMEYSWNGGYTKEGSRKLKIPVTITATAQMENGIFKSYGKKAVATREYTVWLPKHFELNGAVYTLGDLLATTTAGGFEESSIDGDVYVCGTGLSQAKRMEQYYNGGICAVNSAVLKIKNGNAYTRNLVRAGTFDEGDLSPACAIVVDKDIVAQGIQVFGSNDSIVVSRDAYTFDDIELSGFNSYIAVNGNYYGLNPGDDVRHDTSSAIINVAPRYSYGLDNGYMKSRIVINGDVFVNGATFRIANTATGLAGHKMEDVALAWKGTEPAYIAGDISAGIYADEEKTIENFPKYMELLKEPGINGFSVILQNEWVHDNLNANGNLADWSAWITEIRNAAGLRTNTLASIPTKVKGFCNNAIAANNKIYFINRLEEDISGIKKPDTLTCNIANDITGLDENYFGAFSGGSWDEWDRYTDANNGMPDALKALMEILEDHVQVFARKTYDINLDNNEINYSFVPGLNNRTQFMNLSNYLEENILGDPLTKCVLRYEENDGALLKDVMEDLVNAYSGDPLNDKYFIVLNFNPDKELRITGEINGVIFSLGKVVIEKGGKVYGSVIAAGRGYDPVAKVKGSAAGYDINENPRLPKVVIGENVDNFKNWDYAALVFENGGSIEFPGREALLEGIKNSTGYDLNEIF